MNKHLQMNNISNNRNINMENFIYEQIDSEREKTNSQSKENSIGLKKSSSVSRNKNNQNSQNLNRKNPPNTIIHNSIYMKKKRNVSLNNVKNKNEATKINHKKKNHKLIDLSDRENSIICNLNQYECINNNNKTKERDWISYIQSKTQRAKEYSMIVKKNNMANSINHNSDRDNILSSASKSKSISKSKQKIKGRSNSNVSINKPRLFDDISFWVKKINLNREKKKKEIEDKIIKGRNVTKNDKNKKSRNTKNDNMFFKSSSIENNKRNILSSSSLSINVKTVYNNKNYRIINNNKSNKKDYYRNSNNFINNDINTILGSKYAQLYNKKNMVKNSFDNNNFSINNHTVNTRKPLISYRINKGKIHSYKN